MDNKELIFKPSIREDAEAQQRVRDWIAALRSDKYTQCKGRLHLKDDGFCCLGVLLDQIDHDAWSQILGHDMGWRFWDVRKELRDHETMSLAHGVWQKLHLRDDIGSFNAPGRPNPFDGVEFNDSLTRLNDDSVPFAKIADKIEHDLNAVLAG